MQTQTLFDILKSRNIPDTLLKTIVDMHTNLTPNYQNWIKFIKVYTKVALSCLHCLIYTEMKL